VKNEVACAVGTGSNDATERTADGRTRDRVVRLLLELGPATAAELGDHLRLSSAAVRRHLDALVAEGRVDSREQVVRGPRGRGRPARVFALTDAGRENFPHTYDDLATTALRYLARLGGEQAVAAFAAERVAELEQRCRAAMDGAGDDPVARREALAAALSAEGYAASASAIAGGGQLCQHHCPVAHVAAEFPQLCEAETHAISRLVGSHVQRLATIAHGDGVCTTYIPAPTYRTDPTRTVRIASGRTSA
jgi:predicted ArsR family transcriptional regulator